MKKSLLKKIAVVGVAAAMMTVLFTGCGSSKSSGDLMDKVVKNGELVVTLNTGNSPWTYKDGDDYDGFAVALIKGYCKELGVKCKITPMKFESMIPAINSGKADIICTNLSRTVERSQNVMFTENIGVDYGVVIIKKSDSGKLKNLEAVNKKGVNLTTETGSSFETVAKNVFPKATMKTVDTTPNAIQALKSGRADGMMTNMQIAKDIVKKNTSLMIMKETCYVDPMSFAVDSDPSSVTLLNSFNGSLEHIKADGTYAKLWKKYTGNTWDPNADPVSF